MNEMGPRKLTEEQINQNLADDYVLRHPETTAPPEDKKINPEILKFEKMFDDFEAVYSIEILNAIIDVPDLDDLIEHPVRKPAKHAFNYIWSAMKTVTFNQQLDDRYVAISKAIGVYDASKRQVDHERYNNYHG